MALGVTFRRKFLTNLKLNLTHLRQKIRQPLVISQVMRMTLVALMILVRTMPRLLIVITIGLVSFSFR